jgi:two-component system KDP operon response regulator KdpE
MDDSRWSTAEPDFDSALVIDDEPRVRSVIADALRQEFDRVIEAGLGKAGIEAAERERPALVILDLGLPDIEGVAVCRAIRRRSAAPIIVVSARHSESEKVMLLDAGADDYITKPFGTSELRARVRAQIRRVRAVPVDRGARPLRVGELRVDRERRTVTGPAGAVHLTPLEWSLLTVFAAHPGRTLTHSQIFREVWGDAPGDAQAYLRVHIANLRRKLEPDPVRPRLLITEPGVGYRFEPDA